ncbi:hypothetical protein B0H13DRAFT_1946706 [Mycena leptocephala]|nr:hypothetical protein B0H13DRAFT_1946706 [Mycena leptocephala]
MSTVLGVIDPALVNLPGGRTNVPEPPTTNGATTSRNGSRLPQASPPGRPRTYSKAEIETWAASNYAPRRDANETRSDYDERLTNISRKNPLLEACNKLKLKVPKNANLDRLRAELSKHWFTSLPNRAPGSTQQPAQTVRRRSAIRATDAHDVLAFVLVPTGQSFNFSAPAGALPTVSSNARGELRGSIPLVHLAASNAEVPASSSRAAPRPRAKPRPRVTNPSAPSTIVLTTSSTPSTSSLLPSAIPHTPEQTGGPSAHQDAVVNSPLIAIPPLQELDGSAGEESEAALLRRYDVAGANAYEMLGYEDDDDGSEDEGGDGDEEDEDGDEDEQGPTDMNAFRVGVRVAAVQRFEANRRAGGRKTQAAMVKAWNTCKTLKARKITDNIVDEHSLLLYINFCAERPKRTRKGADIPGTFIGVSHLKKLFFGALRIRKEQDAADPALAKKRPATSVIVYDSIKTRMDEALERERNGLTPEEDAPDIRANTWLSQVTDEQLRDIGFGFLAHRQLRLAVWGHLSWTAQHASGNRGDDFRALKLAELQPTQLKHPDKRTDMYAVLGMQGEEKAGKRGMRTVINPVYSVFIANLKPEMCPLGAFAFYFHYIYDEKKIIDTMELDYTVNKSWRGVRVLHGPKSPTTPFNEQNLYNLYCRAYASGIQEAVGVDPLETSKLGWVRGQTYMDTYAPALPKTAILGAAGYQADEVYDPIWRRVRVPPQFLLLVCPMAESMLEKVAGNEHLSGAFHHWEMVIELREYLFQCGAAIWQSVPGSCIFRLPAFQSTDVRNWMSTGYPAELSALQAAAGNPVELERIQNVALVRALTGMNNILSAATNEIRELRAMLERRTAVFTPARGFSASVYHQNVLAASSFLDHDMPNPNPGTLILPAVQVPEASPRNSTTPATTPPRSTVHSSRSSPRTPRTAATPRLVSQVQLVLPALAAFYGKGAPIGLVHPVLGMQSARWVEDVFPAIQQPEMCWSVWGPNKTLDQFKNVQEIWEIFANGERIAVNQDGTETHMKPPLKLVEQFFKHKWRTSDSKQVQKLGESCATLYSRSPDFR